jgi:hypothetical protein
MPPGWCAGKLLLPHSDNNPIAGYRFNQLIISVSWQAVICQPLPIWGSNSPSAIL